MVIFPAYDWLQVMVVKKLPSWSRPHICLHCEKVRKPDDNFLNFDRHKKIVVTLPQKYIFSDKLYISNVKQPRMCHCVFGVNPNDVVY